MGKSWRENTAFGNWVHKTLLQRRLPLDIIISNFPINTYINEFFHNEFVISLWWIWVLL
jgi:hypothetical protein